MASAGSGTTSVALLLSFSAVVFLFLLLRAPAPSLAVADLLASALDRILDARGLLELATRRNMILLCHAILFLILRDAGLLGAPGRRRSRSPPAVAVAITAVTAAETAVPAPARSHATRSAVVRRRLPRNRAALVAPLHEHDAAGRVVVECWPAAQAASTWAAPVPTTGPPAQALEEAAAKQIVPVESPGNDDDVLFDHHDRAAVVEPDEHPTAIAEDGEREDCGERRIVAIAVDEEKRTDDTAREQPTEMEMEMELADDRTFEEFIESQRRKMRQESLQLLRLSYQYQAIATCY